MNLLDETKALANIRELLADAQHAKLAVAFWGKGAIERLGLDRPGLTAEILCNLESGACNPAELRRLYDHPRITLRSHPALHAKVWWTAGRAVLGSSNASANGLAIEGEAAGGWHEANVALDDPAILADIDSWFTRLCAAGYTVEPEDIERAAHLWKARVRIAPTGRRLAHTLFEAWRSAPFHAVWNKLHVAFCRDGLATGDEQWLAQEVAAGRFTSNISAYEGWNDALSPGDLVIDYGVSGRTSDFGGLWQVLPGSPETRLRLVAEVGQLGLRGLGRFALTPDEKAALAGATDAALATASDGRNALLTFSEAMALIDARAADTRPVMPVSRAFDRAMQAIYDEAAGFGYKPTKFRQMLAQLGGVETARRLIRGKATSGFTKLWEHRRLDLSVEALVIDPQWRALFSDEEAAIARRRLEDYNYDADAKR